jgi:hypothetical protein
MIRPSLNKNTGFPSLIRSERSRFCSAIFKRQKLNKTLLAFRLLVSLIFIGISQGFTQNNGPGGPVLVISSNSNPFSRYTVEILRAEGLNEFAAMDISQVTAGTLNNYDVVVLGEIALSPNDVTMLSDWTNAGGTLIAFRPDASLASLLGLTPAGSTLSNKYLLVNTASGPGAGIVNQTIQYHGTADLYTLNGATRLATLYSDANTATPYPAVTTNDIGANGGAAVAFTYDLARSIVYTRQGNPAWAGQKRDGQIDPIRSDDQFFPDWIDFNKVAIPQADEQQHLLTNIILKGNLHRKPLPRFWFLPKGLKAAIVMTGDNHGDYGMKPRFDHDISESPAGCSVDDWECVRSTGYLYVGSTFTNNQAKQYTAMGFEVALHVNTNCNNFTQSQYQNFIANQSLNFHSAFPDIPLPATNRNHCIAWSDWSMTAEVEAANGIRLDVNYYYWPGSWLQDRPGMFTGSGVPMRFAKLDGTIIDCYQVVTQMPDESDETFPQFCNALLDKAIGPEGYYGVFTANMHFDQTNHPGANAIVASAQAHGVPVVSAKQMLDWLDGRNASSFGSIEWDGNLLSFSIIAGNGARNLQAMLPLASESGQLTALTRNGIPLNYRIEKIKGIQYAFFSATNADYVATYGTSTSPPIVTTQPESQAVCPGSGVAFSSEAIGNPTPTVQWQVSVNNGTTWSDISGATASTLNFTTVSADNGNQYRAVWTNNDGSVNSSVATLNVFTASVANQTDVSCQGASDGSITINATGGTLPYKYKIKGGVFQSNNTFSGLAAGKYTVTVKDKKKCSVKVKVVIKNSTTACNSISAVILNKLSANNADQLNAKALPNPSATGFMLTAQSKSSKPIDVRVIDMFGRVIYKARGPVNQSYHFGEIFSAGVYVVEIQQGEYMKTMKIIKQ